MVWGLVWWFILPLVLYLVLVDFWKMYVTAMYASSISWITLEVRIPKEILKTPKSMEQIFNGMHAIQAFIRPRDAFLKGTFQEWISFEIAGTGGGVHFYIHTPSKFKNLIESQVYAQYPDAEVVGVDDYTHAIADVLPNKDYDIWGADYVFTNESPFPIRTYPSFEEVKEERRVDPLSSVIETMSQLKNDELMWIQILIKPARKAFKEEGDLVIKKLSGVPIILKKGFFDGLIEGLLEFIVNLLKAPFEHPTWSAEAPKKESDVTKLTPGKREVLEAVERKMSQLAFETGMRMIYIDRRDQFTRVNVAALAGAFKIFNTTHMNGFVPNLATLPGPKSLFFKKRTEFLMKEDIYRAYQLRLFPQKSMVMSTEELATIYHYPMANVAAPFLHRLETKKGQPPPNLPV